MNKCAISTIIACLILHGSITIASTSEYKEDEILVRFAPKENGRKRNTLEKNAILSQHGAGTVKHEYKIVPGLCLVKLSKGQTVQSSIKSLKGSNEILYAEPDYKIELLSTFPNDPFFDPLWAMHNTGQTGGVEDADIDAPEAWDISTGSNQIVVAVLDTGVDYNHPDLAANMWTNPKEALGDKNRDGKPGVAGQDDDVDGLVDEDSNGLQPGEPGYTNDLINDDDENGYNDDIYGHNSYINPGDTDDPWDDTGHGTSVAGIIGARGNNGEGVTGVCWNIKIMAVKILDAGAGMDNVSRAIEGIEYATMMKANLTNNSWKVITATEQELLSLKEAIESANEQGILFIAAAGNDSSDNDVGYLYPSSYDCDNIISVLATDKNDDFAAWFSNYGSTTVDLGAPGVYIVSCQIGGGYTNGSQCGTSYSAPHVAGAAALIWSLRPNLNHLQVKDIILGSVDHLESLEGLCLTGGRLNLYNALLATQKKGLIINKTDDVNDGNCVFPWSPITYTISYDANGVYDTNVKIVDYMPDEVDYISSSPEGQFYPFDGTVTWNIGTIYPDDTNVFTLTVRVKDSAQSGSTITNRCEIASDYDNNSTEVNSPVCTWESGNVCLDISDDINDENCAPLQMPITYTITYDANGAIDKNVRLIDYLPLEIDYNSSSPAGIYNAVERTVTWNIGNLPPNGQGTITLNTYLSDSADPCGIITNMCGIQGNSIYKTAQTSSSFFRCGLPDVIYVDCNRVNGADNGTSWWDAYLDLQDALDRAAIDSNITQIWVADGNYEPNNGAFSLVNGISLYGHFDGNEIFFSQRDLNDPNFETILSGSDSAVVSASDINQETIIDGFTITDGQNGIGISFTNANLIFSNCLITNNGVGVGSFMSGFTIDNCIIQNNTSNGIETTYIISEAQIKNSIIRDNMGYGIRGCRGSPDLEECLIYNNDDGGVYSEECGVFITRCKIFENLRGCLFDGTSIILNNWIYRNEEEGIWGGNGYGSIIRNNTIFDNSIGIRSATIPVIINSIVWGNGQDLYDCNATYSWLTSNGDPCFVDADNNDFHLKLGSPCIDTGDPNFNDFNDTDIDGGPRIWDGDKMGFAKVDIGADEFYWPKADYRHSGDDVGVDFKDYTDLARIWDEGWLGWSLDEDDDIDIYDLAIFCDDWLWQAP